LLDGAENTDVFVAGVGVAVPLDSVNEFRLTQSSFTAEYGRATGGVVDVETRSGTNNFHGSLYEFNRISALASNNFDNNARGIPRGNDRARAARKRPQVGRRDTVPSTAFGVPTTTTSVLA
jgi:hypothetical protein